jgi:Uma2 family endonuclease
VWAKSRDYASHHPTVADVLLLIEPSDSSLEFDRSEKANLYAAAGIGDYWIVNLIERTVEVHRDPHGGRYHNVQSFGPGSLVAPIAFAETRLDVAALFAKQR